MTLSIEIDGTEFSDFDRIEVSGAIDRFARSFSFEATAEKLVDFPIKVGDPIVVSAGGKPVCTGFVDRIGTSYTAESHIVSVSGRSRTSDIIDSSLRQTVVNVTSLSQIIQFVLRELQIPFDFFSTSRDGFGLQIIDDARVSSIGQFDSGIAVKNGQNAFNFIEEMARKLQVLLTDDGRGNIVITRNDDRPTVSFGLTNKIGDTSGLNNIKRANFSLDISNRFNKYIVTGQESTIGINVSGKETEPKDLSNQFGSSEDSQIRVGRQMVVESEKPLNSATAKSRSEWQANIDRARSLQSRVTIEGHNDEEGNAFNINQLVIYNDDFTGINQIMLIAGFRMSFDLESGSETEFTIMPPDSFRIQAEAGKDESVSLF